MNIQILNQTFILDGTYGKVHDLNKWTETSGGSYGTDNKSINITTSRHQTFWITSPSGYENEESIDCKVANGHEVIIVWIRTANKSKKTIYMKNISSNDEYFYDINMPSIFNTIGIEKRLIIYFLLLVFFVYIESYLWFIPILLSLIEIIKKNYKDSKEFKNIIMETINNKEFINSLK